MSSSMLWGFDGENLPPELLEHARRDEVAGISLFRNFNVVNPTRVRDLVDELREATPGDLDPIVAIDQECGQFLGLAGSTPFAGNMALGAIDDVDLTERVAAAIGRELAAVGINLNYAPVADIVTQSDNPSLGIRSFGSDPALVASHVAAFTVGLDRATVGGALKHFPGKGEARVDPHHGLPVLQLSRQRLDQVELVPFRAGIAAGIDVIMSGHYALPLLTGRDDLPGTVSSEIMTDLIREQLGFEGVVLTDALDMGALQQDGGGPIIEAIAALRAGVDLLLSSADFERAESLFHGLELAGSRGLLHQAALDESSRRVDALRRKRTLADRPELSVVASQEHMELADELARRSVTLVRDDAGVLPIRPDAKVLVIMPTPADLTPADTSSSVLPELGPVMTRHWPSLESIVVAYEPDEAQIQRLRETASNADVVVVGTITANPAQARMVLAMSELVPTIAVALRTPFDLSSYPEIQTYLCTYSILRPSLDALADVLAGKAEASGRLPSPIGDLFPAGHSLGQATVRR